MTLQNWWEISGDLRRLDKAAGKTVHIHGKVACGQNRAPDLGLGIRFRSQASGRLPHGSGTRRSSSGNVRRKVLMSGRWSQQTTKNEPVVGRNNFHWARPSKGAKLTPWLWAGGTKEVRTRRETGGDPGRHGRCAAIEGRVYKRPCRAK